MSQTDCSFENLAGKDRLLPPWFFRNGHIQTLAGMYLYSKLSSRRQVSQNIATSGEVLLSDGDRLVFQDDRPLNWQPGSRVALLLHGLGGSHASPYMARIARLLNKQQVRTFRLDWRGCGAGAALARYPYHSGRSSDVVTTIRQIESRCPDSPIAVIGFSLGGGVALKLLGEERESADRVDVVDRAIAVCPPIDLQTTVNALSKGLGRLYDRYFYKYCIRHIRQRHRLHPDTIVPDGWFSKLPKTMHEFDNTYTAPVCGFESARDYYSRCSANQFLSNIKVPTLVIAAQDDPLIPFNQFKAADYSSTTALLAPRHGGHLGFCTPRGPAWLDRQIVEWTAGRSIESSFRTGL